MKHTILLVIVFLISALIILVGCGESPDGSDDDDDQSADDDDDDNDDNDDDDEVDCRAVTWDYLQIDAMAPPPNPTTGHQTPEEYNKVNYYRFRLDTGDNPPKPVSSILILLPGFTVGANYLTYMARQLVEETCGDVEVWLTERRAHLLEDTKGMQSAEQAKDPMIAYNYYYENGEVDGQTFQGFKNGYNNETDFMSEWGLDLQVNDLRTLIHQVPKENRQTNVFLGGHSRGAAHIKAFAAYEFDDGVMGCDEIAGLVLVDGESRYLPIYGENLYLETLEWLRKGYLPRYITLPPFGPPVYTFIEILAMAASEEFAGTGDPRFGPDAVLGEYGPFKLLVPFFYRFADLQMTNEALFGFFFDSASGPISLLHGGLGGFDGPTQEDFLGVYPSAPSHFYQWLHYDEVEPKEFSEIQDVILSFYMGPSNTTDPYYPLRLDMDYYVANFMDNADNWRGNYFPLYASRMDAPVYFIGTSLLADMDRHLIYRNMLPPVRGQGLPRDQYGFHILFVPEWEHLDSAYAAPEVNPFFPDLLAWMDEFSVGQVQIPMP